MPRPEDQGASALLRPLATPRLRLEPIRPAHASAMFEGLHEPSLYAYQADEPPDDLRELRERYARLASGRSPAGGQHWLNWIAVLRDGGAAAGYVQATVDDDLARAEVGYLVLPAFQRQGIGSEAMLALVRHLVAARVELLEAVIDVRNAASIALIERLGFLRRHTRRSDDVIGGVRGVDHEYVLRAADFEASARG